MPPTGEIEFQMSVATEEGAAEERTIKTVKMSEMQEDVRENMAKSPIMLA